MLHLASNVFFSIVLLGCLFYAVPKVHDAIIHYITVRRRLKDIGRY